MFGAGGGECINGGLEGRAGGNDVVDDDIGAQRIGAARCSERAAHVFFSRAAGEARLARWSRRFVQAVTHRLARRQAAWRRGS